MRRAMLNHPCRPILVHVPATSLDYLDWLAREAQTSRSEVIRQRLAPHPGAPGAHPAAASHDRGKIRHDSTIDAS
jgi:Ribbon-helix-helix protein, copG family